MPERQAGAFVYTGAGRRQDEHAPIEQRLCREQSISIQRCLAAKNHKEVYCREEIKAWRECVVRARATEVQKDAAKPGQRHESS